MPVDAETFSAFDASLKRCTRNPVFLDRFYSIFLESSPKVREKFAKTDFTKQKEMLRSSLYAMLLAAKDPQAAPQFLHAVAERHSGRQLKIGAEMYDLWLDSLLAAVKDCDPLYNPTIHEAWEHVMMVGISYFLKQY